MGVCEEGAGLQRYDWRGLPGMRSAYVVTRRMGCSWPGQEHGERILDTVYRCAKMPR